jgi:hypothetical protein
MARLNSILALLALTLCTQAQDVFPGPIMRTISGGGSFTPSSISGMIGWWAADSISSVDGTEQTSWSDLSGNSYTLTAATGLGPTWETAEINSLPAMKFNGSSQYMSNNTAAANFSGADLPRTFFLAIKTVTESGTDAHIAAGSSTGANPLFEVDTNAGKPRLVVRDDGGTTAAPQGSVGLGTVAWKILTVETSGTSCTMWINGSSQTVSPTAADVGTITINRFTVGARFSNGTINNYSDSLIAEIIIYNSALGSTDRGNVETWLNSKYAIF